MRVSLALRPAYSAGMIRSALVAVLLYLASPMAVPGAAATEMDYTLYVLGIPVADAVLGFDLAPASYRASLRYHTTGLASVVAGNRLEMHTRGVFDGERPIPREFTSTGTLRGQDRVVGLAWRDGTPIVTALAPPNDAEREDVPALQRARTIDPLSTLVELLRLTARTGRCEGAIPTYDGRRLELFQAHAAGEEDLPPSGRSSFSGHVLRCDFIDRTLAGFRLGADHDDDSKERRGTVWLAQVVSGLPRLPVRASVDMRWLGKAMIYLTSLAP